MKRVKSVLKWIGIVVLALILYGMFFGNSEEDNYATENEPVQLTQAQKERIANIDKKPDQLTQAQKNGIAAIQKTQKIRNRKNQTIKASDLVASYVANEVRADENYKGRKFYVTGIVSDIKKDIMGDIYVTLKGSEMFREVQCYFDDTKVASQLEKRMKVTFYGKCDGLMMNVLMTNCELVKNLEDL